MNPRTDHSGRPKEALHQLIKDAMAIEQKRVRKQAKEKARAKKGGSRQEKEDEFEEHN